MGRTTNWPALLLALGARLLVICIVAGFVVALPDINLGDSFLRYKNALTAFFTVVAIGVTLYDTFFYERFRM